MTKVILIGLCILLVGCKLLDITDNITIGDACGFNLSSPPIERFCNESGGEYKLNTFIIFPIDWGCIDKDGEIHSYEVTNINNTWIIGNKSYPMEWSCK